MANGNAGYRDLLKTPGVARIMLAQLTARFPNGMTSLAVLLHIEHVTGSYGAAGLVLAATSVGQAIAGPAVTQSQAVSRSRSRRMVVFLPWSGDRPAALPGSCGAAPRVARQAALNEVYAGMNSRVRLICQSRKHGLTAPCLPHLPAGHPAVRPARASAAVSADEVPRWRRRWSPGGGFWPG